MPDPLPAPPKDAPPDGADKEPESRGRPKSLWLLSLGALGVVFGDIGTSPLYSLRECFFGARPVEVSAGNVLGVLSLITWSLVLIITVKYVGFIMRADNRGEGGILALMALALQSKDARPLRRRAVVLAGLFGAALLYGDGMITPAISVLSAVEGLTVATHAFDKVVPFIAVVILVGLFAFQRKGTAVVGAIFGPVMLLWFATIALLGVRGVLHHPQVLWALNPYHAVRFFLDNGPPGFFILGAVFLVVTGGEALYADMGHFGRSPIRRAWAAVVLPALLLNYYGQGALVLRHPDAAHNPFYRLAPPWMLYPLVVLATLAAVIASQALISGAFSLARQAVQLGYSPRFNIVHTSEHEIGQIFLPGVNRALAVGVALLVLAFRSSSELAAAYGIAVSATMAITTFLAYFVAREKWGWSRPAALVPCALFGAVELCFLSANAVKFMEGGWFPIAVALVVFSMMTTWKRGRQALGEKLRAATFPLDLFLSNLGSNPPTRVPGTAVFMTGNPEGTPPALMHNLKHNKVLHQRVILLTMTTLEVPHVDTAERLEITPLEQGVWRVIAQYGFMDNPDVPALMVELKKKGLELRMMDTTFFLGRETLVRAAKGSMARWRTVLFAWMSRNAHAANAYFNLPPNRVVELGAQLEL